MTYQPHAWGCAECEYERLRKWAIDHHLIQPTVGPANMIGTIIDLVHKMDDRIQKQTVKIKELEKKVDA